MGILAYYFYAGLPFPPWTPSSIVQQFNRENMTLTVQWEPPQYDDGAPVNYTIIISPDLKLLTINATSVPVILPYNVLHTVSIVATNCNGSSSAAMVTIRIGMKWQCASIECLHITLRPTFSQNVWLIDFPYTQNIFKVGSLANFYSLLFTGLPLRWSKCHYLFSWWQQTPELAPWLSYIHTLPSFQLHGNHTYNHCSSDQCVCGSISCIVLCNVLALHAISRWASFQESVLIFLIQSTTYIYIVAHFQCQAAETWASVICKCFLEFFWKKVGFVMPSIYVLYPSSSFVEQ